MKNSHFNLFFLLIVPFFTQGQTINFISGYSYTIPDFAQINEAINIRNTILEWDSEFSTINNMHGVQFGVRRVSQHGFIGLSWEQKLKTLKASRTNSTGREVDERLSITINGLSLETALKVGFFHAGVGIQGSLWNTRYKTSASERRTRLFKDYNFGNIFFLEFDLGRPAPIQFSLRPFYQLSWRETDYKNLNFYLGGLSPNQKAYNDFWGISLLIKNGPKIR